MSKKSKPGDGDFGKGAKGVTEEFESLFSPHTSSDAAGEETSEPKVRAVADEKTRQL